MTRDEQRAAIITAMAIAAARADGMWCTDELKIRHCIRAQTAAFDAQHGLACVLPPEVIPEMIAAAWNIFNRHPREKLTPGTGFKEALDAMVEAGDLTNPPEGEP